MTLATSAGLMKRPSGIRPSIGADLAWSDQANLPIVGIRWGATDSAYSA